MCKAKNKELSYKPLKGALFLVSFLLVGELLIELILGIPGESFLTANFVQSKKRETTIWPVEAPHVLSDGHKAHRMAAWSSEKLRGRP